jgi:glycosyltransferase involved in cell wall biosynthesis
MRILVAQLGARRHYAIPALLQREGLLEVLYTDLCSEAPVLRLVNAAWPGRMRPKPLVSLLSRRVPGVPPGKIRCFPGLALARVLRRAVGRMPDDQYRGWTEANRAFGRRVTSCRGANVDTAYVFNGAGLEVLEHARRHGWRTILEQTAAPIEFDEQLLAEERGLWPGWEYGGASPHAWRPLAEREKAEWELADEILCGSDFVVNRLAEAGGPAERTAVVPYGARGEDFHPATPRLHLDGLHVLFVGTICLRKGIQYLMEAAQRLGTRHVQFRAVGPVRVAECAVRRLADALEMTGPVPRSEIAQQYAWADVLVLPSLSEGSANVAYEAMACGLPVITTPNAGTVVRDGCEGFVVPIRDADAIAERIEELAGDRDLLGELSQSAVARATEFTWDRYGERLIATITERTEITALSARASTRTFVES